MEFAFVMSEESTSQKLTPQRAFELTENKGLKGSEVASMYDVSESWVSQLKNSYKDAKESGYNEGKESVSPTDFAREKLEDALADKQEDDDRYECPNCENQFGYMEYEECPKCDAKLPWDAVEG